LVPGVVGRYWLRLFHVEIGEHLCVLIVFLRDLVGLELNQKLLDILLPLLLGLAVPRVHLVAEGLLIRLILLLKLDFFFEG